MKKQIVVIEYLGHPIFVAGVKEVTTQEYFDLKKQAEKNLGDIKDLYNGIIAELKVEIKNLKTEVKHLKGED